MHHQNKKVYIRRRPPRIPPYLAPDSSSQRTAGELRATSLPLGVATTAATAPAGTLSRPVSATTTAWPVEGVGCALCAVLQSALVGLDERAGLVGEGEGQGLQTAELDALAEDDG